MAPGWISFLPSMGGQVGQAPVRATDGPDHADLAVTAVTATATMWFLSAPQILGFPVSSPNSWRPCQSS